MDDASTIGVTAARRCGPAPRSSVGRCADGALIRPAPMGNGAALRPDIECPSGRGPDHSRRLPMSTPTAQISSWLAEFGGAVSRGEFGKATSMFGDESYWRDLVSFTWNLKTAEGPQQIQAMLEATVPNAKPSNFLIQGEGSEANGVTEGWFTFETATGRGRGHLRLIGGKAWTLLTTLQELKGFEEKKRENRPKGIEHGAFKDRKSWLEARQDEERTLGFAKQPYVVVIGGGQAGIILGARL